MVTKSYRFNRKKLIWLIKQHEWQVYAPIVCKLRDFVAVNMLIKTWSVIRIVPEEYGTSNSLHIKHFSLIHVYLPSYIDTALVLLGFHCHCSGAASRPQICTTLQLTWHSLRCCMAANGSCHRPPPRTTSWLTTWRRDAPVLRKQRHQPHPPSTCSFMPNFTCVLLECGEE